MNNCTCNKNDELRIVRGNAFSLRLTVRALRIDGTPVEDFDLSQANAVLKVEHLGTKTEKTFTVINNDSVIGFDNTLALGWYGLEMTGSYNDAPWRWYVEKVFCIVETNAKANIPAWAILTDDTYMIDVNTSITSGDIYQSDWDETDPQSPSYIQNKPNVVTHEEYDPTIVVINKAISDEETRAKAAEKANADDIEEIEALIPAQATEQNQLADKQYVDDGISTASATYRGAYNLVSDLELTVAATDQQIAAALATKMTALGITPDNNDYCFVQIPTADATPTQIARVDRYKFNGTTWAFEFSLNNSGFTSEQWAALNSGITSGLVTKLSDLPTNSELTQFLNGKEDNSNKVTSLSASSTDTQYPSAKCVYDLHKQNADDIDAIEEKIPSGASSSNKMATASDITNLSDSIAAILLLIPSAASSLNQLADKAFVNSSIATNTATYRGSYNLVSDLSLTISATEQQIAAALATKMTALSITPENNDYCFVQVPTADATPTEISRIDRYKYNGTAWLYEYSLNNSSFTSAQWAAINSGITSALVAKLSALPTNAELTTALGVLTDGIAAINAKIPSAATSSNKLVDNTAMQSYVAQIVNALDATFNITSSDGLVTVQITQTNGVITALAITTSDIASAAALNLLSGRVTTAECNISTNASDIANLQQLYNNLQQSDPIIIEPTDTWPVANPSTHDIYRVIDRVNTPPQYYSDYMWNGTTMVLMAQYDNAIDDEPTPGSNNLVKSGGVAANIVYDISRAHASGSTLATYADLAAALGTNGTNIPASIRRGGMSVKFVQSSDHKYVQYRLMANTWSTTISNWQSVDFNYRNAYYICSSAGSVVYKTVDAPGFELNNGGSIKVKFEHAHDHNNTAILNINSTGNKNVYFNGNPTSQYNTWDDNEVVEVYYDGTRYQATSFIPRDEFFDISAFNNGATYSGLSTALAAVPKSRKTIKGLKIQFIKRTNIGTEEEPVYEDTIVQYMNTYASGNWQSTANWVGISSGISENDQNLATSGQVFGAINAENAKTKLRNLVFQCCSMSYVEGTGSAYSGNYTNGAINKVYNIVSAQGRRVTDIIFNTQENYYLFVYANLVNVGYSAYYNVVLYDSNSNPVEGFCVNSKARTIFAIPPSYGMRLVVASDYNGIMVGVTPNIDTVALLSSNVKTLTDTVKIDSLIYNKTLLNTLNIYKGYINSLGNFVDNQVYDVYEFACTPGQTLYLTNSGIHTGIRVFYAFYKNLGMSSPVLISQTIPNFSDNSTVVVVPDGANYVCVSLYRNLDAQYLLSDVLSIYRDFYLPQQEINSYSPMSNYACIVGSYQVFVAYNNHEGIEYVYWFERCMSNELFTFRKVGYRAVDRQTPSAAGIDSDSTIVWINQTASDNIGPVELSDGAVGGNHLYPTNAASPNYKTAQTDNVKVYADGKELTVADGEKRFAKILICVENTLFDPSIAPSAGDTQLSVPMIKEYVSYRVNKNTIEVALKHKYLSDAHGVIEEYFGMQSMFGGEDYILTPRCRYVGWTANVDEVNELKEDWPNFNRFIEKNSTSGYYQSTYLLPDFSLGNHHLVSNNEFIFRRHLNKSYHHLIYDHTVVPNEVLQWGGSYSFFKSGSKELIIDDGTLFAYFGTIRGKDCLFVSTSQAYSGVLPVPKSWCLDNLSIIENSGFVNEDDESDNFQIGGDGLYVSCAAVASMILQLD